MTGSVVLRLLAAAALTVAAVLGTTTAPPAPAEPCPDVEAMFARGTGEEPGLGKTGQLFVDALRSMLGGRSLGVYAVDYPASRDWPTGIAGIRDASTHIESTAAACPETKMVLGGFSQGAAVMGYVTADVIPDGVDAAGLPRPLPPELADHVAAVVLLGKPSVQTLAMIGEPPVLIGPLYTGKTIELCTTGDPICSDGVNFSAHNAYAQQGLIDRGASYAVSHL